MTKEGFVQKSGEAAAADMEKINRYTRREYAPEEVYVFSLTLCDNEVDRDFERFSVNALETLQKLFLGKTCIFDHERKSANQTARIFDTALEREEGRATQCGEGYVRLTASAYLPRTEKNRETIELIESGILKEVSVSCAVKRTVCSICGKEECSHRKGREYQGKLCCRVLEEPSDAYECSFVAVPAQREAGVRKGWRERESFCGDVWERLKSAGDGELLLTAGEAGQLCQKLAELEEKAAWGDGYRDSLEADILRYSGLLQPEVPRDVMKAAVESLSLGELSRLGKAYETMAQRAFPLKPQLAPEERRDGTGEGGNAAYRI